MELDAASMRALAALARLDASDQELAAIAPDLERILAYVDRLAAFDDPSIAPLRHPNLAGDAIETSALRADLTERGLALAEVQALAPAWEGERFAVPRTIDQG
jgi:aspartyl-tRNA(Asn)/glutamyl-tRNA(Gln) amidotransferase subunit C